MVCIYCGKKTTVNNSRLQKQINNVWRRRECLTCHAIFSTLERVVYENTLAIQRSSLDIVPFQREKLFLSIYNACKHRPHAITDATALTDTVISKLLQHQENRAGLLVRDILVKITAEVLKQFDNAAYVHYAAFHASLEA